MTNFTIASFNFKNLIGEDKEYYKFQNTRQKNTHGKQIGCLNSCKP